VSVSTVSVPLPAWLEVVVIPLLNIVVALFFSGLLMLAIGVNPLEATGIMIKGAFGYDEAIGYTLYYTTNFIFTGLAVAVAFHASLFNIGGEGQAYIGGLGVGLVFLALDSVLPTILLIPLGILAAGLFGAAWAFIPAWLQAYRGSHIVITTIMFNFIGAGLMVALLAGVLMRGGQSNPESREVAEAARLPYVHDIVNAFGYQMADSPLNLAFPVALLACIGVWLLIWRTRWGFALRTMGESESAAVYAGVPIKRMIVMAMAISGGLAGLMAINTVLGAHGKVVLNFPSGFGFTGIAVALMGRSHPVGIILAAFLFGALFQGGTELDFEFQTITREMVLLIQGLIILFSGALSLMFVPWIARLIGRA